MNGPPSQSPVPTQVQQLPFGMPNAYSGMAMNPQMASLMQMQMNSQYSHPHAIQSVMRDPSPIPLNSGQGYLGMNGGF